jgi:pyruvate/2-oxoglutarate dehydrogenase complex dihydrolipoamide acyltransferase (E2) component
VTGSAVFRFPIELKRLLRYLENKRQASGIEINVTHVTIKAAAMALQEMPSLNGHICLNRFYRNQSSDVSYLFPLASGGFTSVVVNSAETKAVDVVSRELLDLVGQANTQREPFVQRRREILGHLPPLIADAAEHIFGFIGSQLGISVPSLGIQGFPFGTCTVVTPPAEGPEMEVDVIGNNGVGQPTMAPVVISVGGIRVQSGYMKDKQMAARPVLHWSAAVDLRCATFFEAKHFFERLQTLLRDPSLLEKASSGRA